MLGLNQSYTGYGDKIRLYAAFLRNSIEGGLVSEDDVIVLVDAYDVLLFPSALNVGQVSCALAG